MLVIDDYVRGVTSFQAITVAINCSHRSLFMEWPYLTFIDGALIQTYAYTFNFEHITY